MSWMRTLVVSAVGLVACGGSEAGDCIDAVQVDGESYVEAADVPGYLGPSTVREDQLGDLAVTIAKSACGARLDDGEATTLPEGTELFFVDGEQGLLGQITTGGVQIFVASSAYGTTGVVVDVTTAGESIRDDLSL